MSYTPTTWTTGDTITATAMNKIENGIANAGSACIRLSATGIGSGTKNYCAFVYAYRDNNTWVVCNDDDMGAGWITIAGYATPYAKVVCIPLPSDNDVGLFLLDYINDNKSVTGDITSTATTLYWSYGSSIIEPAYRITGNGSFEFIGT